MSERQYLDITDQRAKVLAGLVVEACETAAILDEYGARGFKRAAWRLRAEVQAFGNCLPASIGLVVAEAAREHVGNTDGDDVGAIALRSLLRLLDPAGSSVSQR